MRRAKILFVLAPALLSRCARDPAPHPSAADARAGARPTGFRYEVVAGPGARELSIDATFGAGASDDLAVDEAAAAFVRDVALESDDGWSPVAQAGKGWRVPACAARGCRVRYRFLLAEAARRIDDVDTAAAWGDTYEAPPSTWLLRPSHPDHDAPYVFRVAMPAGALFVTGVAPEPGGPDATYRGDVADLPEAPYSAFGPLHLRTIASAKEPTLAIVPAEDRALPEDAIVSWADAAARAVVAYYGRFPVPRLMVVIAPQPGDGVDHGKTLGDGGATIVVDVGTTGLRQKTLDRDWVLTHEMVHTALPSVFRRYHWLEEGIATYVEPIARARVGTIPTTEPWKEMVEGMPQGLPEAGDQGLDATPTWGRTYWGGALFCLLADVELRTRTQGKKGLEDALRGIVDAGGSIYVSWELERVLDTGDRATGVPVLRELHAKMAHAPFPVDLDALWKRLGVVYANGAVTFDDGAPLAYVRKAITPAPH